MVGRDEPFDVLERLEALEDAVLKHSVELVLEARQHRILLVDVKTELLERGAPVELVQVEELEPVNDLAHAGLHFGLIKETLAL
eukprot:CAMPEP_0170451700 /NCGR_PEP_ID=MMETSP0123-20130129/853_1 /TAXON_ID=182087 /ORGANISM="Favella ehrenbergii, Strain Fehren 1" /LENGTH=83 /DNA_ID=CAMNT_0010713477 /DNA_START=173 /DNA_END=424 /DNA_ORIENTATION=-